METMYDYGTFLKLMVNHLENNVVVEGETTDISYTYPEKFIPYPLKNTTIAVAWNEMGFTPSTTDKTTLGNIELRIDVFTLRDRGLSTHLNIINLLIDALKTFDGYVINSYKVETPTFDRTVSAIKTTVLVTTAFSV